MRTPNQVVDPIAAEARAVENGAHAMRQLDGSYLVRSASRDDVRHRITFDATQIDGRWLVRMLCSCESGQSRAGSAVPCWHSALVGRRLIRDGWAVWDGGLFYASERAERAIAERGIARRRGA